MDAPNNFQGDYAEWIRLVADACDGLACLQQGEWSAVEALSYRRSVWGPEQEAWANSVLAERTRN